MNCYLRKFDEEGIRQMQVGGGGGSAVGLMMQGQSCVFR